MISVQPEGGCNHALRQPRHLPEPDKVICHLRDRIVSVVLKTFELEHLRVEARVAKFTPVGFHISEVEASSAEQLRFACTLSLEATHGRKNGDANLFEMEVFGEAGFESSHWEIQHISDVRASAQQTLTWW